jgi:hypothetical protein
MEARRKVARAERTVRMGSLRRGREVILASAPGKDEDSAYDEVVAKARDLIAPVLGSELSSRLIAALLAVDTNPDIRALGSLLRQVRRAVPA